MLPYFFFLSLASTITIGLPNRLKLLAKGGKEWVFSQRLSDGPIVSGVASKAWDECRTLLACQLQAVFIRYG